MNVVGDEGEPADYLDLLSVDVEMGEPDAAEGRVAGLDVGPLPSIPRGCL